MKIVDKPWGREIWWAVTNRYVGKVLEIKAGQSLSLQYHRQKLESMLFRKGKGWVVLGQSTYPVCEGVAVTITPGTVHRIIADQDLEVVEVSTPELEDVVRLEDIYGRVEEVIRPWR